MNDNGRNPHLFLPLLVLILSLSVQGTLSGEGLDLWGDLEAGSFDVGFKVLEEYDHQRRYKAKVDYRGRPREGELDRPVQIHLWYPAAGGDSVLRMPYQDHVDLIASEKRFGDVSEAALAENRETFLAGPLERGVAREDLEDLLRTRTSAVRRAPPADGTFPLIVMGQGRNASPIQHSILCEYLASHGYVVATSPSSHRVSPWGAVVEDHVRDLEFLTFVVQALPFVDDDRLGVMAFSFSGVSAMLFQIRNQRADALLSLDGWEGFGGFKEVGNVGYYDPAALRVPFLYIAEDPEIADEYKWGRDWSFLDELMYSERYIVTFPELRHIDLSSFGPINAQMRGFAWEVQGKARGDHRRAYRDVCTWVRSFFDAHVKGDAQALAFLRRPPAEGKVELEHRAPTVLGPTFVEIDELIREEGIEALRAIYQEVEERDPEVLAFPERTLAVLGTNALRSGDVAKALGMFLLNRDVFPDSAAVYERVAAARSKSGDVEKAIENYRLVLEKLPGDTTTSEETRKVIKTRAVENLERLEGD